MKNDLNKGPVGLEQYPFFCLIVSFINLQMEGCTVNRLVASNSLPVDLNISKESSDMVNKIGNLIDSLAWALTFTLNVNGAFRSNNLVLPSWCLGCIVV